MTSFRVLDSSFVQSAAALAGAPPPDLPEICFMGRSNVGKSSAINALLGRRKLARVSGAPGQTRLLNFFRVRVEAGGARRELSLCDLPGYGYSTAPREETARWKEMIEGYVAGRPSLASVVSLVDARHPPSELDGVMAGWLRQIGKPFFVVATKTDKLSRREVAPALARIARALELPGAVLGFSARTGEGRDGVWSAVLAACLTTSEDLRAAPRP